MRFILLLKPEFQKSIQEIAQKYAKMGVSELSIIQSVGIICGETNNLSFKELSDNEWVGVANIRKERKVQGY